MNTIASNSKVANRHPAGTKTAVLLASFVLAVGTVVSLNAQEPLIISATKSILLEWPVPAEECIVVGTTSLTNSVWTPWPQPIFMRFGKLCMAVPATNCLECFKLVSGTQFFDDFSPAPQWPFATKGDWVPYFYNTAVDPTRFEVTNINNALRIRTVSSPLDGRIFVLPPGPEVVVGDFYASVDIIDWPVQARSFGIVARGQWTGNPSTSNGYMGLVGRNPDEIRIFDGTGPRGDSSFTYEPAVDYRLEFSGVGSDLSLRLVNLTTGKEVCHTTPVTNSRFSQGMVGLWGNAVAGGSCDITLDNFFATGTKP